MKRLVPDKTDSIYWMIALPCGSAVHSLLLNEREARKLSV